MPVIEPQASPLPREERASPMLRDADGGESHAPAFLGRSAAPAPAAEATEEKKPRRRRAPRSFEGTDAPTATEGDKD
jgi:hypothetical protein